MLNNKLNTLVPAVALILSIIFSGFHFSLSLLATVALVVFLFIKNKKLTIIPFAIYTILDLVDLFDYFSFVNLLFLIVDLGFIFLWLSNNVLAGKIDKSIVKRLYFAPAGLYFLVSFINIMTITLNLGVGAFWFITRFISNVLVAVAYFFIGNWLVNDEETEEAEEKPVVAPVKKVNNATNAPQVDGYRDLMVHVLLLLFTCGIYLYFWIYKTTIYLNNIADEEDRDPTVALLLCMFVPFYYIYWVYKSAQRIDKLAISKGQQSDISTMCLIFAILVGIIPPIMMQDKINSLVAPAAPVANAAPAQTAAPVTPATSEGTTIGVADELKKYKELLDEGVITQEEFDTKKKQLLQM